MGKIFRKIITIILFFILLLSSNSFAQESKKFAIYFTGIGCPHCAKVSPVLHKKISEGNLIVIEYEIYNTVANSQILSTYSDSYDISLGIPQILFSKEIKEDGDSPIISKLDEMVTNSNPNEIFLQNGKSVSFENFDLNSLNRYPTIYSKDRVITRKSIKEISKEQNEQIKNFIYNSDIQLAVEGLQGKVVKPEGVKTSSGTLKFENAININGWLLQWNGKALVEGTSGTPDGEDKGNTENQKISFGKILSLGLADSVNPCALSILALVLISIITYNPGKRKDVLYAGLCFILSVIVMYFIYGILIVKAFEVIQSIGNIKEFLFGKLGLNFILGIVAIILGALGLKDFISYKPGGIGTEMPLFLRPKASKLIAKVTSPIGAFGIGAFVTLFLLPCTIGPYIILGGLLADEGVTKAIPSLILYNIIFIIPMLIVTLLVYFGTKNIEDVKDWKDKNVRYMHLISGILLLAVGILMVSGKF